MKKERSKRGARDLATARGNSVRLRLGHDEVHGQGHPCTFAVYLGHLRFDGEGRDLFQGTIQTTLFSCFTQYIRENKNKKMICLLQALLKC